MFDSLTLKQLKPLPKRYASLRQRSNKSLLKAKKKFEARVEKRAGEIIELDQLGNLTCN